VQGECCRTNTNLVDVPSRARVMRITAHGLVRPSAVAMRAADGHETTGVEDLRLGRRRLFKCGRTSTDGKHRTLTQYAGQGILRVTAV
jgi:hypothetical protein